MARTYALAPVNASPGSNAARNVGMPLVSFRARGQGLAMTRRPDILCIGSVLWDILGRAASHMELGADVPGRIVRRPGGVAMNVAVALAGHGLRPAVLSAIGRDAEGDDLAAAANDLGIATDWIYRSDDLPTEAANGLIAAIADAHSLEAAGARILAALGDGRLADAAAPWTGPVVLDGNLSASLLAEIARGPLFAGADLRLAPASPGKAERLTAFLGHGRATLYLNLEEARILTRSRPDTTVDAAEALLARGLDRAIVTDGANAVTDAGRGEMVTALPPRVMVTRVTGAGDSLMAGHIAAEMRGVDRQVALHTALQAAAAHISGETPL
jgi:pseudouridine kinase